MSTEKTTDTIREPVIYCTWDALLKELDNIGVGNNLTEWQLRTLRKGLFAARTPRDIKPHKLVKDGHGDWTKLNDTLFKVRLAAQHTTASRADTSNATKLSHLKEWANAAENLVKIFKGDRDATYHRFCEIALEVMGSHYALNSISRWVDKINGQFEIELKCKERENDLEVKQILNAYSAQYKLSPRFKSELKSPHNLIHIIRLIEVSKSYGIEPLNWLNAQIEEEAKLGRTLNLPFSYNAIAVDRMSKLSNQVAVSAPQDDFLKALNNHVISKKRSS